MATHLGREARGVLLPELMSDESRPTSLALWFVGAASTLALVYGLVGIITYFATQ